MGDMAPEGETPSTIAHPSTGAGRMSRSKQRRGRPERRVFAAQPASALCTYCNRATPPLADQDTCASTVLCVGPVTL